MVGSIFETVLNMAIVGGYGILVVLIARLLLKGCERKYSFYLWFVVFISLCIPVRLQGSYSLIPKQVAEFSIRGKLENLLGQEIILKVDRQGPIPVASPANPGNLAGLQLVDQSSSGLASQEFGNDDKDEKENRNTTQNRNKTQTGFDSQNPGTPIFLQITGFVWISGILFLLLIQCLRTMYFQRRVLKKVAEDPNKRRRKLAGSASVLESEFVVSPFLWGIFRPVIYLPAGLHPKECHYILAHERYHQKRKDYITKGIAFAITILYWFHPLVWIAYALFCTDMEISCDEMALQNADTLTRKAYASSLLRFAAKQNGYSFTSITFGEPSVRSRINHVMKVRRKRRILSIVAILIVAVAGLGLFLFPKEKNTQQNPDSSSLSEPISDMEHPDSNQASGITDDDNIDESNTQIQTVSHASIGENYLGSYNKEQYYWEETAEGIWQVYSVNEETGERKETLFQQTIETGQIQSFGANDKYIVYSAGEVQGSLGMFYGAFYSFNRETQRLKEVHVTEDRTFTKIGDFIYYQKFFNQSEGFGLYRMDLSFEQEEELGNAVQLAGYDEERGILFGITEEGIETSHSFLSMNMDGSDIKILMDMEAGYFAGRMEENDKLQIQNLISNEDGSLSFEIWQWGYRGEEGYRDTLLAKCYYQIQMDGTVLMELPLEENVVMIAESSPISVKAEKLNVTIRNNSQQELVTGLNYQIEKLDKKEWIKIPEYGSWNDIACIMAPGEILQITCDFDPDRIYEPGTYRVVKTVYQEEQEIMLTAEFIMVE